MKKLITLIAIVIVAFTVFIIIYLSPKEYSKEYEITGFKIIEKFHKEESYYEFTIGKEDYIFTLFSKNQYLRTRKLIENIEIVEDTENKIFCILPQIKNIDSYPLCYENNMLTNYSLIDNVDLLNLYRSKEESVEKTYENIKISNFFNKTFLIWNYKGFYYINSDNVKEIKILENDAYDVDLITVVNNYLFIPNYDEEYKFKTAYLIDIETGESDIWNLDYEIYFDSYIMGSVDKSIYLYDKKNSVQYELVPHKKKMRKLSKKSIAKIWNKTQFEDIALSKLENNTITFNYDKLYTFDMYEKKLYMFAKNSDLKTKVSNLDNPKIIYQLDNQIYYLKDDKLYGYDQFKGEQLLLEYFEWNFNNSNMIFVY